MFRTHRESKAAAVLFIALLTAVAWALNDHGLLALSALGGVVVLVALVTTRKRR